MQVDRNTIRTFAVSVSMLTMRGLTAPAFAQSMRDVEAVARQRGLTNADLLAAAKTFHPSGMKDEFIMFASGGHSGQCT